MNKSKIFIFIITAIFFSSCSTVKEGFKNQKKSGSDEFLVEKKSPLVMPPDFNELPIPKERNIDNETDENGIKILISKNKNTKIDNKIIKKDISFEESLFKKIKDK